MSVLLHQHVDRLPIVAFPRKAEVLRVVVHSLGFSQEGKQPLELMEQVVVDQAPVFFSQPFGLAVVGSENEIPEGLVHVALLDDGEHVADGSEILDASVVVRRPVLQLVFTENSEPSKLAVKSREGGVEKRLA